MLETGVPASLCQDLSSLRQNWGVSCKNMPIQVRCTVIWHSRALLATKHHKEANGSHKVSPWQVQDQANEVSEDSSKTQPTPAKLRPISILDKSPYSTGVSFLTASLSSLLACIGCQGITNSKIQIFLSELVVGYLMCKISLPELLSWAILTTLKYYMKLPPGCGYGAYMKHTSYIF